MEEQLKDTSLNKIPHPLFSTFEYHHKLSNHFKDRKKTWEWFAKNTNKTDQSEAFKTDLLKNSYRLDKESHQDLYKTIDDICIKLNIDATVTLYQEHNSIQLNAGISIIEKEAHIVFSGNIIGLLSDDEMKALLSHELSHYLFYKIEDGCFEISQRIILALANDTQSDNNIIESARIFQLYMELFCDNGAFKVCNNYETVVKMLVKLNTNLQDVNAESYINQAKEILSSDTSSTQNNTHPESYIRSIALYYLQNEPENYIEKTKQLIQGNLDLNNLDIFNQKKLLELTESFLQIIIKPRWMNSASVLNLCTQYFAKFFKKTTVDIADISLKIEASNVSIKNYFSYVLLDFAKVDKDLEGIALAHTFEISELINMKSEYEKIVRKEFKLTVREFKKLKEKSLIELQNINESKEDSLYNN